MQEMGEVEMVSGNADSSYELPVNEQNMIHIKLTNWITQEGQRENLEQSRIMKTSIQAFASIEANLNSYDEQVMLHDGRLYLEEKKKEEAAARKAKTTKTAK